MSAAVYRAKGVVVVEEVPVPEPGPGQVLLEVSHCGICGTDVHQIVEGWARPGTTGGHEYSGVVAALGTGVNGWAVGDRAVGGPGHGCGTCRPCAAGQTNLCHGRPRAGIDPFVGAFAGYKLVDASAMYRVPDSVELRTAALTEPLSVAWRGVRRAGVEPGDRVLVTGAGPIGLLTVAVLRALGVDDVTVSEPAELRRQRARAVGAPAVVAPDALDVPALPMDVAARPFTAAIECSGRARAVETALANLDRGGRLVLSGTGMERAALDGNRVILNELVVTGTVEYTPGDYAAALDLLAAGTLPVEALLEPDDQPLSKLQWAVEQLAACELAGKVLVVPRG